MDQTTRTHLDNIHSKDTSLQNLAYEYLMEATENPVDWTYEAWDELVATLRDKDNHQRAIAGQLLGNLAAYSDPEKWILRDFDKLLAVTKDERFVTARHVLLNMWKIGLAGEAQRERLVEGLAGRFRECITERNCTLIRFDITGDFKKLYDRVNIASIRDKSLELIETEEDLKYRKKYAAVWKSKKTA
jgi:hypothetical protein